MKKFFRQIIILILRIQAKIYLKKYKPQLILVCGQIFRTNVKDELVQALKDAKISARGSFKGYNSEIGIPLSILNQKAGFTSILKWFKLIISGFKAINDPSPAKMLVLEIVVDNAKEMNNLLKLIKPDILIFTDFDQSFAQKDLNLAYENLVNSMAGEGTLLINNDYKVFENLGGNRDKKIFTFGKSEKANIRAIDIKELGNGQQLVYLFKNSQEKMTLPRFGDSALYSALINKFILSLKI
ncbi:hypothetical protein JW977_03125 [Candidatus Falkowbacteria bacterium]|nr:hypothetical protein [Candidatus Falkowbacteria bacterium]